jgi:hypothetical protein
MCHVSVHKHIFTVKVQDKDVLQGTLTVYKISDYVVSEEEEQDDDHEEEVKE